MKAPVSIEASLPRRVTMILTLAVWAALGGFLISYLFPPHYTATATLLAEDHFVVIPVITVDFTQSVQTLGQNISTPSRLRPVIHALSLGRPESEGKLISEIQQHMYVEPVITTAKKEDSASSQQMLGLNVEYTDRDAVRAQRICDALTSLIVDENLRLGSDLAHTTVDFLPRQLKLAKDDLEHKRAQFRAISKSPSPRGPKEEATYEALALDYANAHAFYNDLLAKTNTAELSVGGVSQPPLGEHVLIDTADLPEAPSFPKRPLFSLCGLGAGLLLGSVVSFGYGFQSLLKSNSC
jgi:uncharacterized protein involved in exopolysaccharide biosynthesis